MSEQNKVLLVCSVRNARDSGGPSNTLAGLLYTCNKLSSMASQLFRRKFQHISIT